MLEPGENSENDLIIIETKTLSSKKTCSETNLKKLAEKAIV